MPRKEMILFVADIPEGHMEKSPASLKTPKQGQFYSGDDNRFARSDELIDDVFQQFLSA